MKSARFQLEDLSMMLNAIAQARKNFLDIVDAKYLEACKEKPPRNEEVARKMYSECLICQDAFEAFQRLMNLYGCVGGQAKEYVRALDTFNVVPIRPQVPNVDDEAA